MGGWESRLGETHKNVTAIGFGARDWVGSDDLPTRLPVFHPEAAGAPIPSLTAAHAPFHTASLPTRPLQADLTSLFSATAQYFPHAYTAPPIAPVRAHQHRRLFRVAAPV